MQKKHRRIPYGTMNRAEIVRECHFVDNTACIRVLENCKTPVFLRPKRFGKTVVCSMLAPHYDVKLKDRFDELFGMTDIGRDPTDEFNSYLNGGTWQELFEQYWRHYVKARIPAQAFDQMNENFFRTTFTSRCFDVLPMFFSFETEYNTPEGRCDFLAVPKPGVAKHALLIEFKYFTRKEVEKVGRGRDSGRGRGKGILGRTTPDAETKRQALDYVKAVTAKPDWGDVPLDAVVVEVCSSRGYNWIPVN